MSITYESEINGPMLLVTASGRDENVQQVIEYGLSIIHLAVESGATHILCDERNLEYALGTTDTYDAAKQIAMNVPRVARVAIVCRPEFLSDGKFWETVAVNRGLQVRIDTDFERARHWLEESRHQPGAMD